MKVFWSWQSDTLAKLNKDFVKAALNDALAAVSDELDLSEADRPELDHDTKGEAGLVEIVATIFRKIEEAQVFVADITFVGKTASGKHLPNPNVMIELGHALTSRGAERIILVANEAFEYRPEDLPFDLRHRRGPITYNLPDGATREQRKIEQAKLTRALTDALRLNLGAAVQQRTAATPFNLHPARPDDRSTWLEPGAKIRHQDSWNDNGDREWVIPDGPRYYMRVIPAKWTSNAARKQVLDGSNELSALGPWRDGDFGLNKDGLVNVGIKPRTDNTAIGVAQWFKDTGEIWGFNGAGVFGDTDKSIIADHSMLREWRKFLRTALDFLARFEAHPPIRVEAGIVGISNTYWPNSFGGPIKALDPEMYVVEISRQWDTKAQDAFMLKLYNKLRDAYGVDPISSFEELAKELRR